MCQSMMKAQARLPGPAIASSTSTPVGLVTLSESVFMRRDRLWQKFRAGRLAVDPHRRGIPVLGDQALVVKPKHVKPGGGVDMVWILGVAHLAHRTYHYVVAVRDHVDDMHLHARL